MTDDRKGGLALIAGAIGSVVTMILHPTGRHLMTPGQIESMALLAAAVHALAIASMPILFLGGLVLTRRLDAPDRLAIAALVVYGFALAAVTIAAAASGFIAPDLLREMVAASPAERDVWHALLDYNSRLNQAFAKVFTVGSSAAIVLWSVAIVKNRALPTRVGYYGLLLGPAVIIAVALGRLRLDVHGEGLVIMGQAVWFIVAGTLLARPRNVGAAHP